jgi:hypothetical protein
MKVFKFYPQQSCEVSLWRQCRETKGEFSLQISYFLHFLIVLSYFVAQRKQQICSLTPLFL